MQRFSSLEEANARIPEVKRIFDRIVQLNERSLSLSRDLQDLFDIWGEQIHREGNPDFQLYHGKKLKKEGVNKEIQQEMGRIAELGGMVKDLQKGLVDFYFEREDGEGIYLCWKAGEDKISHWHPRQGGFAARRPIEELFQASYI